MKRRVLVALAGAALLFVVALTRGAGPTAPPAPATSAARMPERSPLAVEPSASPDPPPSTRNPFVYGGDSSSLRGDATMARPAPDPPLAPPDAPVPEPVHFVGFVRRAGGLQVALSIEGQIEVVAAGDEASGYRILSVDEESGVQIRGPDGLERTLAPEP